MFGPDDFSMSYPACFKMFYDFSILLSGGLCPTLQSKGGCSKGDDDRTSVHKKRKLRELHRGGYRVCFSRHGCVSSGDRGETANCLAVTTVRRKIPDTEGNKAQISATTIETKTKPQKTSETMLAEIEK